MSKHILVCLPISAEQRTRIEAVQGFAYRFTTPDTATVEDALWAEYRQIEHILTVIRSVGTGPIDFADPNAREMLSERVKSLVT